MAAKYTDVITTDSGTVLPGATVQLLTGAGALVTTYTNDALTQNPSTTRTADPNGIVELYVADGTYTVRQAYGNVTRDLANVELYDISTIVTNLSNLVIGTIPWNLPDEANGDTIPSPGSKLPYLSAGVLKIA